ncbi:MAG TPA: hypothetical protein EYP28_02050 [Methanophagales archaeon]|nr:hypothetical protein [Methanophagales archaeon]
MIITYQTEKVKNFVLDDITKEEQAYYERKYGINGEYLYQSEAENLGLSIPAYFAVSDEKKERVKNSRRWEYGAEIYHGGERIDLRVYRMDQSDSRNRGGKRSEIRGFSKASRYRLFKKIASLHQEKAQKRGRPIFVTLTYPEEYPDDFEIYKRDLDVFAKRVRRKYPSAFFVWRLEFQKRGAPHYHCLIFGIAKIPKTWLSKTWYDVVGSGDEKHLKAGTKVERVRSWRGVWSYVSKYLGKVPENQENVPESTGRFWGVYNKEGFGKCVVKEVIELSKELFYRARRILARATNYSLKGYTGWMGLTAFVKADSFVRVFDDTS